MLNQFVLIGRIDEIGNDTISLKVQNATKNEDGVYTNNHIFIKVGETLIKNIKEYCTIGDLIGVKGQIKDNNNLVGEKVTFLSSRTNND